ncbi:MAG: ergothioneine biosynthesis protein EgtB [Caldilineae bacterium]|nr:ergothioneine biosynthesis protein EgtB [Chloroflexota bacterium]MCB9176831.1 ergothioneine biosynthesis protein EgtB [Caldilineae bacterium]
MTLSYAPAPTHPAPQRGPVPGADPDAATLLARYRAVRAATERFCEPLATEDYVIQTMDDVSPAKWHLAHTTWFFECFVLQPQVPDYPVLDPMYNYLFNSYYNTVGYRHCRPKRGLISRPTVAQVYAYRAHVDAHMTRFLEQAGPEALAAALPALELGFNHEQQHQELMVTDIKHVFSENPLFPAYRERPAAEPLAAPPLGWTRFERRIAEIGHAGPGFAFDNEGPRHETLIPGFELASRPVSCGEYLAFMQDGGYTRHDLWLSLGWNQVQEQGWRAPMYWQDHGAEGWRVFTLAGLRPLDPAEPVCHLSYFEADAYARWAGARLPSEAEWELAAVESGAGREATFAEDGRYQPAPARTEGLTQLFGEVWEWTRSPYEGYPGYAPAAGALGEYNGKFMCNQYVLRGGSCATPRDHIRASYRNFFPPDARWQFSGLRLARDLA